MGFYFREAKIWYRWGPKHLQGPFEGTFLMWKINDSFELELGLKFVALVCHTSPPCSTFPQLDELKALVMQTKNIGSTLSERSTYVSVCLRVSGCFDQISRAVFYREAFPNFAEKNWFLAVKKC